MGVSFRRMEIEPLTEKEYRRREYLEKIRGRGIAYLAVRDIFIAVIGVAIARLFQTHGNWQSWMNLLHSTDFGEWAGIVAAGCYGGYREWSQKEKELAKLDARGKDAGEKPYSDHAVNSL